MRILIHTLVTAKKELIEGNLWSARESMLGDVVVSGRGADVELASTYLLYLPKKDSLPFLLWLERLKDLDKLLTVEVDYNFSNPLTEKLKPLTNLVIEPTRKPGALRMIVKSGKQTWTIRDA
jgi:hypothetical protein